MRKIIGFLLSLTLFLTACSPAPSGSLTVSDNSTTPPTETVSQVDPPELSVLETEILDAVRAYVYAQLLTDRLSTTDLSELPIDQLKMITDKASQAWALAESTAVDLENAANLQAKLDIGILLSHLKIDWTTLLFQPLYAADPATEWAEAITSQYDKIKGGNRLKQLGEQLGTDARRAFKELVMAQDILQRDAANSEGDLYERWQKYMEVTKAASKTALFVCATIVTAGASTAAVGSVTLAEATGIVIGGIDVILEVGATSSNIVLGKDSNVAIEFDKMKDVFAPVSMVFGIYDFSSAVGGGKISFIGDNLLEWFYNNKIAGIKLDSSGAVKKDTAWVVDTTGKTDEAVRTEIESSGGQYPDLSENSIASISESFDFDIESLFNELDKIMEELRDKAKNTPAPTETPTAGADSATATDLDGTYSGTMILYSPTGTTDEDSTSFVTIKVVRKGDRLEVSDDEELWLMDFDVNSKTAYYEEDGASMTLRFISDNSVESIIKFEWNGTFTSKGILNKN